jgi:RNA polymerase sigma factor (TIGR02999 family)
VNIHVDERHSDPLENARRERLDGVMAAVYDQLRLIAARQLWVRDGDATLSPTGLVHELYLKLVDQSELSWRDRAHFFALASLAMRHMLVDRAKARLTQKRQGGLARVTLEDVQIPSDNQADVALELDEAMQRLAAVEPRLAQVVEYRFFLGLSEDETAAALGLTTRTVQRDWQKARMLLRRALSQ